MELQNIQTIEDLEQLGIGRVYADISYRGGGLGFYGSDVAAFLGIPEEDLPSKFGAGCNYLGGGLRGAIFPSSFSGNVPADKAEYLTDLAQACKRVYENIENEEAMNDEEYEDGSTNWDAKATNATRQSDITSAY